MNSRIRNHRRLLVAGASLLLLVTHPGMAQNPPDETMINGAADRLNTITPQAVPKETIRIGTSYGAGQIFEWAIPGVGELPEKLNQPEGTEGVHVATMNSFNMTYEFGIPSNRPADFRIVLYHPDGKGRMIREVAKNVGSTASVSFHPRAVGLQRFTISGGGRDTSLTFRANMPAQIGAFVVPNMLLTIVYEPAGDSSTARYSTSSSYGTTMSLGFARTSGVVKTENPDWFLDVAFKVGGPVAEKLGAPNITTALSVLDELRPNREVIITKETTTSQEESSGWTVRVERGFETELTGGQPSPGTGDRYIILLNVLFVYVVVDGKVHLAPMKASAVIGPKDIELDGKLPPALVASLRRLNPHHNPDVMPPPAQGFATLASLVAGGARSRFSRVELDVPLLCESSPNTYSITRSQIRITTRSTTSTETVLKKTTGAIQSLLGSTDPLTSVSYSSTVQQMTGSDEETSGTVECNDNQETVLDVYFDNVYRTILLLPNEPLVGQPRIRGTAQDARGRPLSGQVVTLKIGGRSYRVRSDGKGNFSFRFSSIPTGTGMLSVGNQSYRINYTGSPKHLTLQGTTMSEQAAAPPPDGPVGAQPPRDVPTAKPGARPTTTPTTRPRRP